MLLAKHRQVLTFAAQAHTRGKSRVAVGHVEVLLITPQTMCTLDCYSMADVTNLVQWS